MSNLTTPAAERSDACPEEIASAITHGVGALLAVVGLVVLVVITSVHGSVLQITTVSLFGVCLVGVYTASTLMHALHRHRLQHVLLECDHISIFLLIGGTYTPLMLVSIGGGWGWSIFGVVWGLSVAGIVTRLVYRHRLFGLRTTLYVVTGWAGMIAVVPMVQSFTTAGLLLVVGGGVAYTAGIGFFVWNRLPFNHAIWHVFVLAGSACHFAAVWIEVVQRASA